MPMVDDIIALAEEYLPGVQFVRERVASMQRLQGALTQLQALEERFVVARNLLEQLKTLRVATGNDFQNFEVLRDNLYRTELGFFESIRYAVRGVAPNAVEEVPEPAVPTAVDRPRGRLPKAVAPPPPIRPLAGLGNAETVLWASAAFAFLGIPGLAAVLAFQMVGGVRLLADVLILQKQVELYIAYQEGRLQALQACLDAGGTAEECATVAAGLVAPPDEVLPEPSRQTSPASFWFLLGGTTAVGVLGTIAFFRSDLGKAVSKRAAVAVATRR